ncbi:glutathione S-transferase theta-1-like [Mercenaria mercenaria]|uniref:glutathione S-transferase theta-1-like n=1 Tax=Mercenaria mercenaria TaxID=6596 RepID=UPI00234EB3E3|nr:glutathione S-transferase theta-1-like [Mercenaria mercenaria]
MAKVLEFHYDLLSQPCRAVYLFLKCSGVQFKGHTLSILKGEHMKPEYLKINPFHKVPVIIDGDFILAESAAIMRYVATTKLKAADDHWYPKADAKKQARVDEFLHWQGSAIRAHCITVFLGMFKAKIDIDGTGKKPLDVEKDQAAKEEIKRGVQNIADYFLKDQKKQKKQFIAGDKVSAADILGVCELYQLHGVDQLESLVKSNPDVKAWMERVEKALGREWNTANAVVNSVREQYMTAK